MQLRKHSWFLWLIPLMFIAVAAVAQDSTAVVSEMEQEVGVLLTAVVGTLSGLISSVLLGGLKKVQVVVDSAFFKLIKPMQPVIVLLLTALWPYLATQLGFDIGTVDVFLAAPFGTVVAIAAREGKKQWGEKFP